MNMNLQDQIIKLHTLNDDFDNDAFAIELIKSETGLKNFSLLNLSTSDLTYHVIFTSLQNVYVEDLTFFDIEIEGDISSSLFVGEEEVNVFSRLFFNMGNIKYAFLIHDNMTFNEEVLSFIIKNYIVAHKNRMLIHFYQRTLLNSQYQLDILNEIGDLLGGFDLNVILAKLLENAINIVEGDVGVIYLFDNEHEKLTPRTSWGVEGDKLLEIKIKNNDDSVIYETFKSKEIIFQPQIDESSDISLPENTFVHSLVTLPLFTKNENLGVLILVNFKLDETFVENKLVTLESLSKIASIGIENSIYFQKSIEQEKFNTQLNIAANIQQNLLPSEELNVKNVNVSGVSMPAMNVGGDFYSYMVDENKIYAFLGDVSGKGIPAALLTTMAMIVIKTSIVHSSELEKIIFNINNTISEESLGENYLTLGMFEIDLENEKASVVGCSQEILFFKSREKRLEQFESKNLPVGMFDNVDYMVENINFEKGDMLFTFSDGITDAINVKGEDYGMERLKKIIIENSDLSASELKKTIVDNVIDFSEGAEQFDDLTILVVKRV